MRFLLISLILISTQVAAYPIFFQCDAEGRLSDQMTTPQVAQKMQDMLSDLSTSSGGEKAKKISEYCNGGTQCMQEMRELLKLAEISGKISDEAINAEIAKVTVQAKLSAQQLGSLVKMPEGIFKNVIEYQNSISSLALARECRVATAKLDPELMKLGPKECLLANFHHSPYMYPTGVRVSGTANKTGDKSQDSPSCEAIDDVIQSALITDHDPFAALAISLMENGPTLSGLSLDPIGIVQTLGCPTSPGTRASHDVNSYGTFYHVKTGLVKNPKFVKNIEDMAKIKKIPLIPGKGAVCMPMNRTDEDGASTMYSDRPISGACCVEIPYSKESFADVEIDKLMTYTSFDKYLTTPLEPRINHPDALEKVARRLQRFNGYSDSMGGAENVPAWRSGINFFKTPTYGYQAVDFMLNTLWNNPYVRQKIAELEIKIGKRSKSVLCQDLATGGYAIEHDLFFRKHADAPRMTSLRQRLRETGSFQRLPARDQNVLTNEIMQICEGDSSPRPFCDPILKFKKATKTITEEIDRLQENYDTQDGQLAQKIAALEAKSDAIAKREWMKIDMVTFLNRYWTEIYPQRSTVGTANFMDQGFTWTEMSDHQFGALKNAIGRRKTINEDSEAVEKEFGL